MLMEGQVKLAGDVVGVPVVQPLLTLALAPALTPVVAKVATSVGPALLLVMKVGPVKLVMTGGWTTTVAVALKVWPAVLVAVSV